MGYLGSRSKIDTIVKSYYKILIQKGGVKKVFLKDCKFLENLW